MAHKSGAQWINRISCLLRIHKIEQEDLCRCLISPVQGLVKRLGHETFPLVQEEEYTWRPFSSKSEEGAMSDVVNIETEGTIMRKRGGGRQTKSKKP